MEVEGGSKHWYQRAIKYTSKYPLIAGLVWYNNPKLSSFIVSAKSPQSPPTYIDQLYTILQLPWTLNQPVMS